MRRKERKITLAEFKKSKAIERDNSLKLDIVRNKLKEKVIIRKRNPYFIFKGFRRHHKKYDSEYSI